MTSRERVMTALKLGIPDRVPFFDQVDPGMQAALMGKKDFDPLEFARFMDFDALAAPPLYPPFFARMEKDSGGREILVEGLIKTRADLYKAQFPKIGVGFFDGHARFVDRYGTAGLALYTRSRLGPAGIFNSMGLDGFSYALADDIGLIEELLDRYAQWASSMIRGLQGLGFDFLWFSDDVAFKGGPLCSPEAFRQLFIPYMKAAVADIKVPWVYHSDGDLNPLLPDLLALGMSALNPIEPGAMDIERVKAEYSHRICLMGNIDLGYTLTRGTVEETTQEVRRRIEVVGRGGGYILASANSIPDYCIPANVIAMRDALHSYGWYE